MTNNVFYVHFIVRTVEGLSCHFIPAVDTLIEIRQDSLLNILKQLRNYQTCIKTLDTNKGCKREL